VTELTIPEITEDDDTISAALKYAAAGWYVLPVSRASKHAGSILGKGWPAKTSRDTDQIVTWFAGSSDSLALHMGRSGAVAFDVDHPERIPGQLEQAAADTAAPFQSTRLNTAGRGHYIFAVPEGRTLGNGTGGLGKGWGDVRGANGIIIVAPSTHEKEADGARYHWERTGPVPVLPSEVADLLRDAGDTSDAATDEQLKKFLADHTAATRPELLSGILTQFATALSQGQSRHEAAVLAAASAVREAAAGLYPARQSAEELFKAFATAMQQSRDGQERTRSRASARGEFLGIYAWAIGQLTEADIQATRASVDERMPRDDAESLRALIADPPTRPQLRIVGGTQPMTAGTAALQIDEPEPDAAVEGAYSLTDDGNALRLINAHESEIRYVPERSKWLIWEGHRWTWDDSGHVRELMKAIARDLPIGEPTERKHRSYSLSARGTSASLQQACSDKRIVARASALDSHVLELNTPGGIVNLLTGETSPSDPAQMHTRSATVAPEKMATPRWDSFIEDTFGGDMEMAAFVQRLAGYSASGDVRYQILPFLFGGGQNGKSVLMDVLRSLFGDYAAPAPAAFLMAGKHEHSAELAQLQGLRLVIASEVNQDARFDEAKMKELTGGEAIRARFMRQDFFTFEPTHHLWLMGNHQPEVKAGGDSFWRRLRLVPFLHKVPDHKKIENLSKLLVDEEGPGILHWVIQGAVDVFNAGLRPPESVMAATRAYADEEDHLGRFLESCCMRSSSDQVRLETKKLRSAYEAWCHAESETPLKPQVFGRELKRKGISRSDSNGRAFYAGLSLLATEDAGWGNDDR
jgi:P4 family phage/plasmid primase-like protien